MLRDVIDDPAFVLHGHHPVRLFIGSGMPTGLWQRLTETFAPARVVSSSRRRTAKLVLANVAGAKGRQQGPPLPGGGEINSRPTTWDSDLIPRTTAALSRLPRSIRSACYWRIRGVRSIRRHPSSAGCCAVRHLGVDGIAVPPRRGRRLLAGGNRNAAIHTARGVTFPEPITGPSAGSVRSIWPSPIRCRPPPTMRPRSPR